MHKKWHLGHGFVPTVGTGAGEVEVRPGRDKHLDGARVLEQAIGNVVGDHATARFGIHHGRHVLGTPAIELLDLGAGLGNLIHIFVGAWELAQRHTAALPHTTFGINRAEQPIERMHRHGAVGAAWMHGCTRTHPDGDFRCGLAHGTGHTENLRDWNQGLFFCPGRCAVFEFQVPPLDKAMRLFFEKCGFVDHVASHKQVFTVLEVAHKLAAPHAFGQQHMGDGTRQRTVGAGVDGQPLVCLGRNGRHAWVNGNHGAAFHNVSKVVHGVGHHAVGAQRVAAPGNQAVGFAQVVIAIAKKALRQTRPHFFCLGADGAV